MSFRFNAYQIHIDEEGPLEVTPLEVLDYGTEKFLACEFKEEKLLILLDKEQKIDMNNPIKVRIDIDDMQVFDKEKNIRLV